MFMQIFFVHFCYFVQFCSPLKCIGCKFLKIMGLGDMNLNGFSACYYPSFYLSFYLYFYLSFFLNGFSACYYPSFYLSIHISIYLSFYPYVYLSLYLNKSEWFQRLLLSSYLSIYISLYINLYFYLSEFVYLCMYKYEMILFPLKIIFGSNYRNLWLQKTEKSVSKPLIVQNLDL